MSEFLSHIQSYSLQDFIMFSRQTYVWVLNDHTQQFFYLPVLQVVFLALAAIAALLKSKQVALFILLLLLAALSNTVLFYWYGYSAIFHYATYLGLLLALQALALITLLPALIRSHAFTTKRTPLLLALGLYIVVSTAHWWLSDAKPLTATGYPAANFMLLLMIVWLVMSRRRFVWFTLAIALLAIELLTLYLLDDKSWLAYLILPLYILYTARGNRPPHPQEDEASS